MPTSDAWTRRANVPLSIRLAPSQALQPGLAQQIRWLDAYGSRDADDVHQRDIPLAAFNFAHVTAIDFREVGQSLLR